MANPLNYTIFVDGLGFLTGKVGDGEFFTNCVEEARSFKRKDANTLAVKLCERYPKVWTIKKCSLTMTSESYAADCP